MARSGRPKADLVLSDVERDTLLRWSRRAKTSQALALRARIVLACAEGETNKDVAVRLGIWPQTVTKWRGRFIRNRLEGLSDEPRPGAARTITDEQVEAVIVTTLEQKPANGDTHWSTRSMARSMGMSQTVIELETDVQAWIDAWNDDPKPFVWTTTADKILDNLASYCTRLNQLTNNSGH